MTPRGASCEAQQFFFEYYGRHFFIYRQSLPDGGKRSGEDAESLGPLQLASFELVAFDVVAAGRKGRRIIGAGAAILNSQTGEDFDQRLRAQILRRRLRTLVTAPSVTYKPSAKNT